MKQVLFAILVLRLIGSAGCGKKEHGENPTAAEEPAPTSTDTAAINTFADTALEAAVRAALGKPAGPLTSAELLSLKELDAGGRGIADLKGIEELDSLTTLVLRDNQVEDLSPLAALRQLRFLDLDNNRVRDVSPLAGLAQLESVVLSHNEISDFSPLLGLEKLKSVELEGNPIGDEALGAFSSVLVARGIQVSGQGTAGEGSVEEVQESTPAPPGTTATPIVFADEKVEQQVRLAVGKEGGDTLTEEDLLQVRRLDFGSYTLDQDNRVVVGEVNLEGIQHLLNLASLRVRFSRISGFGYLAGLDKLATLELWVGGVEDASALAGLGNLTRLVLSTNQIEDLSPLAGLTQLAFLELTNNRVKDVSALAGLTRLSVLGLGNDAGGITFLGNVTLAENQISDITPLAKLTDLTRLYLSHNQITDIEPLVELKKLIEVDLTGNPLGSVSRDTYVPALRARGVVVEF